MTRREIFGLRFVDATNIEDVAAAVLAGDDPDRTSADPLPLVVTPNVDQLIMMSRDATGRPAEMMRRAAYTLPDGQPIVTVSRLLHRPLRSRLTGSDLTACMWAQLAESRRPTQVIASSNLVADRLRTDHPDATVIVAPMLHGCGEAEIDAFAQLCIDAVDVNPPEFVFVTLSFPQRELVIDSMLGKWPSDRKLPTFLAVGASFDMYFGLRRRAPRWIQNAGLEWFYRFVQEPRRLFQRYFLRGPSFFRLVWHEWRRPRPAPLG